MSTATATATESATQQTDAPDLAWLVRAAANGDRRAWNHLVQRYEPLVRTMTRRYRLSPDDSDDVTQFVWLKLLEYIETIREPRAVPGWIKTVARNEALRVAMSASRCTPVDPTTHWLNGIADCADGPQDAVLRRERRQAAAGSLRALRPHHQEMMLLLNDDVPYAAIGQLLRMPVGSIGPIRARCLAKLRGTSAIRSLSTEK